MMGTAMTVAQPVVVLAGAVLGFVAAMYAWDHWIPHLSCAAGDGRYQFLNCLSAAPPLWLNFTMMVAGMLLALAVHALFRWWRSLGSAANVT